MTEGIDISTNTLVIDTTFSASSEHVVDNGVNNQPNVVQTPAALKEVDYPDEEYEWQVEPGTSHTDAPSLLHVMDTAPTYSAANVRQSAPYADYSHSVHAQPRYLQEDYQQFQLQQQALHQQRLANSYHTVQSGVPNVFGPGYDFSSHVGAHMGNTIAQSPSAYNTTVHVHITSPVPSHYPPGSPAPMQTATTTYTTNTTTLSAPVTAGGSYLIPLHVPLPIVNIVPHVQQPFQPPSHLPSPFSGTDRSVGSLEFSNDTSPSLHGLSTSYGNGNNTNRSVYQYEEHSVADSGIGMGNLPLSRTHSGVSANNNMHPYALHSNGSAPNSPQLRTMAPCPRRPNFNLSASRQLGFDTPSPRRQLSGNNSHTGSFNSNSMFDRDSTTSFSPSFIAELETEREGYFVQEATQLVMEYQARQAQIFQNHHQMSSVEQLNPQQHHSSSGSNTNSRRALQVSTPERQEAARANALIRKDHSKDKFSGSY